MRNIGLKDTLSLAFTSIWTHRFRSGLTILGIVIGITTVITVAALLTGLRKSIVEFFEDFGPNSIFVARLSGDPSGANAPQKELKRRPLSPEVATYLKNIVRSIDDVGVSLYYLPPPGSFLTARLGSFETENIAIAGQTANLFDISPRELREGRYFTAQEDSRAEKVALIGSSLADALFPKGNAIGQTVLIDGAAYTIIGVFAPAKGGFFGENGLDRQVIIPLQTARLRYPLSNNFFLTAKSKPGQRDDAVEEIRAAMRQLRHVPAGASDDFSLSTADSIIKSFDQVTGMIIIVSIAISGIGLLVGGIGVMNIMLVSVTERTREIGVRKAVGARKGDIILQFLMEAVALTATGGTLGIALSATITFLLSLLLPAIRPEVPIWAVTTGFLVSVAIGIFFGVWPSVQAARLDPVIALRYE
jgi:putative ABC transport system permease protein